MSISKHHNEWLALVEQSGPFLTLPVLLEAFPQGLDPDEPERVRELRDRYEDWVDEKERRRLTIAHHREWILYVLRDWLQFKGELLEGQKIPPGLFVELQQYGERIDPDFVLVNPKGRDGEGRARLLVQIVPADVANLDRKLSGRAWSASPNTRMAELLRGADIPLGLVTNGEQWTLVSALKNETIGFASFYSHLFFEERSTLHAFQSLLSRHRFFGVSESETLLKLLERSCKDQAEVTDQLGYQVRRAVEVIIQTLDRIDKNQGRKLLAGISEKELYEAALTVMMRLVFLFSAEERGLLLLDDDLYESSYAVSTLRARLREGADQHGEELLERRFDAWGRLLATFRAVHGGIQHERLRLPAYGGHLFDPDRYPFLEGRKPGTSYKNTLAAPLAIDNRTVLHLLESLQTLEVKVPGGPAEKRKLSFRALDIEQIGHVYEGLLDHTAVRAKESNSPVLGLRGSKDKEPEIPLPTLESYSKKGRSELVSFLHDETGRSEKTLEKELTYELPKESAEPFLVACDNDPKLWNRVKPFASLVREDTAQRKVIFNEGSLYVTKGADRRSTGTHYTPRSLTEPIVQYTLEPLVYVGPAEGNPKNEWKLKPARELLALKVCDMAMGSGAFLVQATRYLSERLVESWEAAERANPGKVVITPEGDLSTGAPSERPIPRDSEERHAIARRYVADRCIYGVDINPMAVEMAKLSLWLITLQKDRPFTFLDHALKCGDSLLGVSSTEQIQKFSLRTDVAQRLFASKDIEHSVAETTSKRKALESLPSNDHIQIERKQHLHEEAEAAIANVKALADCIIAFELKGQDGDKYEDQRALDAERVRGEMLKQPKEFKLYANQLLNGRRAFHWAVEFPEVFARGGFNAFVGNPPFLGGWQMPTILGPEYCYGLKSLYPGSEGTGDLVAFFFRRSFSLLRPKSCMGLLATKSISEADTRKVGLDNIVANGGAIYNAIPLMPWPGEAAVVVARLHITNGSWKGGVLLDGTRVSSVSPTLSDTIDFSLAKALPHGIEYSQGTMLYGGSFVRPKEELPSLLSNNPGLKPFVRVYVNGDALNHTPHADDGSIVIDFGDLEKKQIQGCNQILRILEHEVTAERANQSRQIHENRPWLHWDKRLTFYRKARSRRSILASTIVSKYLMFIRADSQKLFAHGIKLFLDDRPALFAVLQSTLHAEWAFATASKLGGSVRYSTSVCFDTYPFPSDLGDGCRLDEIGRRYEKKRDTISEDSRCGVHEVYGRFHSRGGESKDIAQLRSLHMEMDSAVAAAYGWNDIKLDHDFHPTKQGIRFTISEAARRIVLDKLLKLNHERYAEEVKQGLHEKKAGKGKGRVAKSKAERPSQKGLFDREEN
ncbi:MAG: restriction endonuclease [Planctomycetes bacterium]|nr:restriction endonuclease [Planctomycetota bacterium]